MNARQLMRDAEQRLLTECHKEMKDASAAQLHNAVSGAAMDAIAPLWKKKEEERFSRRKAAYLSMEYLVGRLIYNNLYCMGLLEEVKRLLSEKGVDPAVFEDIEDDAFGNGGSVTAFSDSPLWTDARSRNRMTGHASAIPGPSGARMNP